MFGTESDWYLMMVLAGLAAFVVTLGGVHIWTNLGSKK